MSPGSSRMPFALIAELRGLGLNADLQGNRRKSMNRLDQ